MPGGIHPPIEVILSWPKPNYKDPVTQTPYVLLFSCILGPISILLLVTRLWIRVRVQRKTDWDDWLMLAALGPVLALTILWPLVCQRYRFDRHVWDVEFKYYPIQRKYVMAIYSLFTFSCGLIKMSILLFYRRLSSRAVSPAFRWTLRLTIGAIAIFTIIFTIIPIFLCTPIKAFWLQLDIVWRSTPGNDFKCLNEGADVVANGIISSVQDFISALLPTILCWNLQMPARQKIALYSIFAISYLTVGVGAYRAYVGYRIYFMTYDVTWYANHLSLWSLLELHFGMMCANAPALRFLFAQFFRDSRARSGRSKSSKNPNNTYGSYGSATSKATMGEKLKFWKSSQASKGYISDPSHTQTTTDHHGGIIHKGPNHDPSSNWHPLDNISRLSPEYMETVIARSSQGSSERTSRENLELDPLPAQRGSPLSSHPVHGNEIQALPPMSRPEPAMWPLGPYTSTKETQRLSSWHAPWASKENLNR